MKNDHEKQHPVYTNNVIEFVTIAAEYCAFLEKERTVSAVEFMDKMTKILPLLYLKAALLPDFEPVENENMEKSVTEEHYEYIREQITGIIGQYDEYLEVFHPDISFSDTPVVCYVSEDLTDVYQDLKDMIHNFRSADLQLMNDSLNIVRENFREYWGQKSLNALRALHNVLYSGADPDDEDYEENVENQF